MFIIANKSNNDEIHKIVHTTINEIYSKYYPEEVVQFFLDYHSRNNITKALREECILLIEKEGRIIGTGSLLKNEIKRMFILPEYQGNGYGSLLLEELERRAKKEGYDTVVLDSSLAAYSLYEKKGYIPIKYNKIVTPNGQLLCYNEMIKTFANEEHLIDYNNRVFKSISNSDNGEVSGSTIFKYKQENNIIWAEYSGGQITRGYLIGTSDKEGKLDFSYQHVNIENQIRTGECKSTPEILSDGRIKLLEEWEWTSGQKSKGSSVLEEVNLKEKL
ncbi:GNAT family N-acetyltransferase [Anaeromicrobium sediminis]|nr:GNAT family N-acetyltransferase [Anaeromicrobium sediminis]